MAKAEELEMSKLKLQARLAESQNTIEQMNNKQLQLEKARNKLQEDLNEMSVQLDQAQILHANMEKRAKQFDRYRIIVLTKYHKTDCSKLLPGQLL